ncbi:MAG: ornithine cyclodeaminase family protein [Methanolinea sp.]|jgi:alanine dehydrogenase|nr:ornithine cyclodeaminase family protein [Methanolinea sp.]
MRYYPDPAGGVGLSRLNRVIEEAFAEHARGMVQMPPKVYITLKEGDFRTMPAYIPSLGIAGVKIVNVHPENRGKGLPTVMALTVLLNVETGLPYAILNATDLTDLRTGAAGAVAAKYLSPRRSVSLGVVGSGRQAEAQIQAIAQELQVREVLVWSRNEKNATHLCERLDLPDCRSASLSRVCGCNLLVTTTPSRVPLIRDEWIQEGTHINAIGADAPGKEELDPAILLRSRVFVDDPAQAVHSGEVNVPIRMGLFSEGMIAGTLGEVILGMKKRMRPEEITIFDSTGLAIQDLAIAAIALEGQEGIELKFP